MAMLATRLAAESSTVSRKPLPMRSRYCSTKSKFSVMPAMPSETQNTAITATQTKR